MSTLPSMPAFVEFFDELETDLSLPVMRMRLSPSHRDSTALSSDFWVSHSQLNEVSSDWTCSLRFSRFWPHPARATSDNAETASILFMWQEYHSHIVIRKKIAQCEPAIRKFNEKPFGEPRIALIN